MMSTAEKIGESVVVSVEVEDNPRSVLLVMDRKSEYNIFPWEDAFRLAMLMEQVIQDVAEEFKDPKVLFDNSAVFAQKSQITFVAHGGLVAMLLGWSDRVRFTSLDAFFFCARNLRHAAQDANLQQRGIHFQYDRDGMIAKLHNIRAGYVQLVR